MLTETCMSSPPVSPNQTYVEMAPPPTDPSIPPSIYWIELRFDQVVEWRWMELPDGNRVVTDFKVLPRKQNDFVRDGGGA